MHRLGALPWGFGMEKHIVATLSCLAFAATGSTQLGTWDSPDQAWPLFPIIMSPLPNGKLLITNRDRKQPEVSAVTVTAFRTAVVDPGQDKKFTPATVIPFWDDQPHSPHNLFCSGPAQLWNGDVFFAGGHIIDNVGTYDCNLFDWRTQTFRPLSAMTQRRWYPTSLALPNRRVLIMSGTMDSTKYSGNNNISQIPEMWMGGLGDSFNQDMVATFTGSTKLLDRYFPHSFIDPRDGQVLVLGNGIRFDNSSSSFNPQPNRKFNLHTLTWESTLVLPTQVPNVRFDYASAVAIDGMIVRSGGARPGSPYDTTGRDSEDPPGNVAEPYYAAKTAIYIDFKETNPEWRKAGPTGEMQKGRTNHQLLPLPNGMVLAFGGNQHGSRKGALERLAPEWWDPSQPQTPWQLLGAPPEPMGAGWGRGYHMSCTLLPDARVIMSGGEYEYDAGGVPNSDAVGRARIKRRGMIFSPPYGGTNDWQATRPTITNAPGTIRYGTPFSMATTAAPGRQISKISLIALSPMTHAFAPNLNLVFLNKNTLPSNAGPIVVNPPSFTREAIPGYYMLFAVDSQGIPSVAKIVQLRDLEPGYPSQTSTDAGDPIRTPDAGDIVLGDNRYLGDGINSLGRQVRFEASAKLQQWGRPGKLRVQLEGSTNQASRALAEAYDWTTGQWISLGERDLGATDSLVEWNVIGSQANRLAQPGTQRVRARFSLTAAAEFLAKIDLVEFGGLPGMGNGSFMQPE